MEELKERTTQNKAMNPRSDDKSELWWISSGDSVTIKLNPNIVISLLNFKLTRKLHELI